MLQGVLADKVDGPVNFVNVQNIAEERGITAKETKQPAAVDFLNLITVTAHDARGELSRVAAPRSARKHRPRLVKVYRQDVDIEPAPHMVFLRYARRARHDRQDRHQDGRVRHQHRADGRRPRGQGARRP